MIVTAGIFCLFIAAGLLLRSEYEKEQLSIETIALKNHKISRERRILFLSDLHNHEFGKNNQKLIDAVNQINPDLIIAGGDMLVSKGMADTAVPFDLLKQLKDRYPVICGNGNHENRMQWERSVYGQQYEHYRDSLRDLGIIVLENDTVRIGEDLAVTGIDLEPVFYKKFSHAELTGSEIEEKVGKAAKERFQVLLCHSPLYFGGCRDWGADLTLSGHFHGGTIRIPFLGGVMTPQFQFFNPYCGGFFKKEDKYMIVSRGLGTHSINVRLNNKPQLVVVDLKPKS